MLTAVMFPLAGNLRLIQGKRVQVRESLDAEAHFPPNSRKHLGLSSNSLIVGIKLVQKVQIMVYDRDFNQDEDEDDLQRLLEGRDFEDENLDQAEKASASNRKGKKRSRLEDGIRDPLIAIPTDLGLEAEEEGEAEVKEEEDGPPGDDEAIEVKPKGASKVRRITQTPRIKLDVDRLKTERGLGFLNKHFEQVQFKGKSFEKQDLNKVMSTVEHWAHRLFPKMNFDDFLEKCEHLGSKKTLSTFITKIRLDMPLGLSDEIVDDRNDGSDNEDNEGFFPPDVEDAEKESAEQAFGRIFDMDPFHGNEARTAFAHSFPDLEESGPSLSAVASTSASAPLTEQQLTLIEEKRKIALEKRNASRLLNSMNSSQECHGSQVHQVTAERDFPEQPESPEQEQEQEKETEIDHDMLSEDEIIKRLNSQEDVEDAEDENSSRI